MRPSRYLTSAIAPLVLAACTSSFMPPTPTPIPPTATLPVPTAIPAPVDPTPTIIPTIVYAIPTVDYPRGLGYSHFSIMITEWPINQPAEPPESLRIPTPTLVASKGRFLDIRGNASQLVHLGSDFLDPTNAPLVPPSDHALLAAVVYLDIGEYMAIALDMAGNVQMYLIRVAMPEGDKSYLICFAHLAQGSNQAAVGQAEANGGHVEVVGQISAISGENPVLSDLHIAAIDVDKLMARGRQDNLYEALGVLFSRQKERNHQ